MSPFQSPYSTARARAPYRREAEVMEKPCKVFPVSMFADQHHGALVTMDVDQGQQSSMPEDEDDRSTLFPKLREECVAPSSGFAGSEKELVVHIGP